MGSGGWNDEYSIHQQRLYNVRRRDESDDVVGFFFPLPSDGNSVTSKSDGYQGCTNYGCNCGDFMIGWTWGENRNRRGVFFNYLYGGRMGLEGITDGTSNTLLFAEILASKPTGDNMVKSTIAAAAIHGQPVSACLAMRGTDGMMNGNDNWNSKGRRWCDSPRATRTSTRAFRLIARVASVRTMVVAKMVRRCASLRRVIIAAA